jgi:hypothetical protein
MPRPPRADEAGGLDHARNRGNLQATIFHKDADFDALEKPLGDDDWVESMARRLNLESTLRPRGQKRLRFPQITDQRGLTS